ncbi:MAG: Rieske (2Fe-2S) protein [Sphingomonadales bacterium]|nr:Rieske (2Fe-2S) protein [Sphingomonadales bacterium]
MLQVETTTTLERGYDNLPLPFGWFAVALSDDLHSGEIRTLRYFGTEFVMWRGEDGELRAIDPTCPHLGAHLGVNSVVEGNDLRCPFHFWTFNGDGQVSGIPYTKKPIPPKLTKKGCVPSWPVVESAGVVYVWYHPRKQAPKWEVAKLPACQTASEWVLGETHEWIVNIHIQEITENGQDHAHFGAVHGVPGAPAAEFKLDGWGRRNTVTAEMNTPRGPMQGKIDMCATGPGQSMTEFTDVTNVLMAQQLTAIDSGHTHVRWQLYHPVGISEGKMRVTKARMRDLVKQIQQDMPIWANKKNLVQPFLVDGDGPLMAYRAQYAKFYDDGMDEAGQAA